MDPAVVGVRGGRGFKGMFLMTGVDVDILIEVSTDLMPKSMWVPPFFV